VQYILLLNESEGDFAQRNDSVQAGAYWGGWSAKARAVRGRLVASEVRGYQPYWVTLANALADSGEQVAAEQALQTAIGLTEGVAIRSFLARSLRSAPSM
jgi:predicted RNA polymerase sigma factor